MTDTPIEVFRIPIAVRQILEQLDQAGYESWLIGGCVRDLCLGLTPKDYDLATNARPEQVQELFEHCYATGLQHGTITVVWQNLAVEITTFRSEGAYSDSRRPDLVVFHNSIEDDLARRDFTMNSLAWRPDRGLLDLHGGLDDLRHGLLRTVGDPNERFAEDALRMLRAVRFAVTYDLTPDPDLVRAAAGQSVRIGCLSRERITSEVLRIMAAPYPLQLNSFSGCGILAGTAAILLKAETDDQQLCSKLSLLIQSNQAPERCLPLLFLAASASGSTPAELLKVLLPLFKTSAGHAVLHLLMHEARLSRRMALAGEAMLYLVCLRLLMPIQQPLQLTARRKMLRLAARRCHLESSELPDVSAAAASLLQLLFGSGQNAEPEPRFVFWSEEMIGQPLTIAELALNGRHLYHAGWPSGPAMRRLLERLLSLAVETPAFNLPADLMASAWTFK